MAYKASTTRRSRKPKSAAQIAAAKKNLEKARAARARKAKTTVKKSTPTKTTFRIKKSTSAPVRRRVAEIDAKWRDDPVGFGEKINTRVQKWSRGKIEDYQHWVDRALPKVKDKKGRSNASKLESFLLANPRKKMRDPRKSLEAQRRAAKMRKQKNKSYGSTRKPNTIYHSSADGTLSNTPRRTTTRRRRRTT